MALNEALEKNMEGNGHYLLKTLSGTYLKDLKKPKSLNKEGLY
jgi:hypothetical protein